MDTIVVVTLAADIVAFLVARGFHRRDPEMAFGVVSWIVLFATAVLGAGWALARALGWAWATYPGLVLSGLVVALVVLKTHRPLLRAISGGRLAKVKRFSPIMEIEARHGARIGNRLRAFIDGEWEKFEGRVVASLPTYQSDPDTGLTLRFGDLEILPSAVDWDVDWADHSGWIPLAQILGSSQEPEAQFLVVRASAPHAVGMWEHETGEIEEVAGSLDELLHASRTARAA